MDFEALGRYVDAIEKATRLSEEYDRKLNDLVLILQRATAKNFNQHLVLPEFDTSDAKVKLADLATLYRSLLAQVEEANLHAAKCGKEMVRRPGRT